MSHAPKIGLKPQVKIRVIFKTNTHIIFLKQPYTC
jgi:hypothetical protein